MPSNKINKLEFESVDSVETQEEPQPQPQKSQDDAIKFSVNAMKALAEKRTEHNSNNSSNKVTLNQLRSVFCRGAGNCSDAKDSINTCGEWALARVNMFLRQKSGQKIESSEAIVEMENVFDISDSWLPSEEDFEQAKADIEKYELNYDFKSIDELYLEKYEKIEIDW